MDCITPCSSLSFQLPFTGVVAVAVLSSVRVRGHSPMNDHWCFRLRTLASLHSAQPNPLLALWFLSRVCGPHGFPVLVVLGSEYATGFFARSDPRQQHRRLG